MKKIIMHLPQTLGLLCQAVIIVDFGFEIYRYFKKPKINPHNSIFMDDEL
jgi:hypothetical protein